ncbi:hypothetical protein [Streptomyces sp. Root369]|uniref:Uncharacterized protein n=1 Tax=Streptomyces sp. 900129855 TaxID=3155129 RepID=A0ABV2ZV53_9ACTN
MSWRELLVYRGRLLQRRRTESVPQAAQDLYEVVVRRTRQLGETLTPPG